MFREELTALLYPVVPKLYPVSLLSQMAGIFFFLLMAPEVAPRGKEVPNLLAAMHGSCSLVFSLPNKLRVSICQIE